MALRLPIRRQDPTPSERAEAGGRARDEGRELVQRRAADLVREVRARYAATADAAAGRGPVA